MPAVEALLDQAAGLRRLIPRATSRVVAVSSAPGAGRSAVCAGLAVALAATGRRVLVLDCQSGGGGAAALLGVGATYDLLDAVRAGAPAAQVAAQAAPGVSAVRAVRAVAALPRLSPLEQDRLAATLESLSGGADWVLANAGGNAQWLSAVCSESVVVIRPDTGGVLEGYRLLKQQANWSGPRRVLVVLNRARPGVPSMRFFGNLSATARKFLGMPLEFLGEIPEDDGLQHASSLKRPVVSTFPGSPAARALQGCALGLLGRDDAETVGMDAFVGRLVAAARTVALS